MTRTQLVKNCLYAVTGVVLLLGLPIGSSYKTVEFYSLLCLTIALFIIVTRWSLTVWGRLTAFLQNLLLVGLLFLLMFSFFLQYFKFFSLKNINYILLCLSILGFSGVVALPGFKKLSGILSLLFLLSSIFHLETSLRRLADKYYASQVVNIPSLAPVDQAKVAFDAHGFRGPKACKATCPKNLIRIITLGGSSTYGLPLADDKATYSAELQRILDTRRPFENYEVLNAGLAGAGIMQELDLLRERLLELKPDVVVVNSWFNDNSKVPGWYGLHGKSDKEAFEQFYLLWKLEEYKFFQAIRRTRVFGVFRHYLLTVKSLFASESKQKPKASRPKNRMSPIEFKWALEEFSKLGKKYDFLPVFMLEPLSRSLPLERVAKANPYYKVILEVAEKTRSLWVNLPDAVNSNQDQWLFYDFIHPNPTGHRLIAEELYKTLFSKNVSEELKHFWLSKAVNLTISDLKHEHYLTIAQKKNIKLEVTAPLANSFPVKFAVWNHNLATLGGFEITKSPQLIELPKKWFTEHKDPLMGLGIRAYSYPELDRKLYDIGTSAYRSPRFVKVVSGGKDYGWRVSVHIDGQRVDQNGRGYNVVVLGGVTGNLYLSESFDFFGDKTTTVKFKQLMTRLDRYTEASTPPIVIIAVKTDGYFNVDRNMMQQALQKIGGTGTLPKAYESFLLVGVVGAKSGSVVEKLGPRLLEVVIGDSSALVQTLTRVRSLR